MAPVEVVAAGGGPDVLPAAAQGFRRNWQRMTLLGVLVAFTGSMVGAERTLASLLAKNEFGVASATAALSFLITFGVAKSFANLGAGRLADRFGRRRILIAGWLVGIPVPLLIIFAPSWGYVVAANALLGVNQGLTWSMALNMKVDLAGPRRRGLAVGFNESIGYAGVALLAFWTAGLAAEHGLRPVPFLVSLGIAYLGLVFSFFAKETAVQRETAGGAPRFLPALRRGLARDPTLSAASFGGFVTNLKDGLLWGLLPLLLVARGLPLREIGAVVALYPFAWAVTQFGTGFLSDRFGRKVFIVPGFLLQGLGIGLVVLASGYASTLGAAAVLGVGTGMVYPTLIAMVSDAALPQARATALGVYRFVRDAGYVGGALVGGLLTDFVGVETALASGILFVVAAGLMVAFRAPSSIPMRGPFELPQTVAD